MELTAHPLFPQHRYYGHHSGGTVRRVREGHIASRARALGRAQQVCNYVLANLAPFLRSALPEDPSTPLQWRESSHIALRAQDCSWLDSFWKEFGEVFDRISKLPDVRAVVLASAFPKVFSAGLDGASVISRSMAIIDRQVSATGLDDVKNMDKDVGRRALQLRSTLLAFQEAIAAPERCLCPVIAAVHGATIGLAIDIISACDVRYAAADALFSIKVSSCLTFSRSTLKCFRRKSMSVLRQTLVHLQGCRNSPEIRA